MADNDRERDPRSDREHDSERDAAGAAHRAERETGDRDTFTAMGPMQDWEELLAGVRERDNPQERLVVNLGPQHPSTHGVLRLIIELEGETVVEARCGIGYLHTGIEKNCEYRTWTQGVTFVTRADYLAPMFNEVAYSAGSPRIWSRSPPRAWSSARSP